MFISEDLLLFLHLKEAKSMLDMPIGSFRNIGH